MYLENLDAARSAVPVSMTGRRSLSGDFVFVSQNAQVAYAAEACIDVLRSANRLIGQGAYTWSHIFGADALAQSFTCGPDQTLVLVGGMEHPWRAEGAELRNLRANIRNAARVCVVGSAIFVPLGAGVLGPKHVAVHPNFRTGVAETGRDVEIVDQATCHHKALSSAVSPTAAVKMLVELIGSRDGEFTRAALSKYLGLTEPDTQTLTGEHWRYKRMAQGNIVISEALQIMLDHLEDTLTVGQIADILEVSPRKLERGFGDLLKQTPLKVYRDLRLERAHDLLSQTNLPVNEISVACGFSNITLMKKWFTRKYGEPPETVRQHAFGGVRAA